MDGKRQNVLGWKTLRDGRLGIVVEGPDGMPKAGPILDDAHDMSGLQFNGKTMHPSFRDRVKGLIRPGSKLDDVGFAHIDLSGADMRGTQTTAVSFCQCDMRNLQASRSNGVMSRWNSFAMVGCDLSGANFDDMRGATIPGCGAFTKSTIRDCNMDHMSMRGTYMDDIRMDDNSSNHLRLNQATFAEGSNVILDGAYIDMTDLTLSSGSKMHLAGHSYETAMIQGAKANGGARMTANRTSNKTVPRTSEGSTFAMLDDVAVRYDPQLRAHYQIRVPIANKDVPAHFLTIQAPEQDVWQQGIGEHVPCGLVSKNRIYEAHIDHAGLGHVSVPVRADMLEGIRTGRDDAYLTEQLDTIRQERTARAVMESLRESGFDRDAQPTTQKMAPVFEASTAPSQEPERAYVAR